MLFVLLWKFTRIFFMSCSTNIFKPALILLEIFSLAAAPLFFDLLFNSFCLHSLFLVLMLLGKLILLRLSFIDKLVCFLLGHSPGYMIRLTHEHITQRGVAFLLFLLLWLLWWPLLFLRLLFLATIMLLLPLRLWMLLGCLVSTYLILLSFLLLKILFLFLLSATFTSTVALSGKKSQR